MSWINRLRFSLWNKDLEGDLDDEQRFHIDMRVQEFVRNGMSPEEARHQATRQFGNRTLLKERTREMDTIGWIETVWRDLRFAARMLRKNPGFTATSSITLALGIGASTAIFSVVYGVLLRPLPYPAPAELMTLAEHNARIEWGAVSAANYYDWKDQNEVFAAVAHFAPWRFNLTGIAEPEQVRGALVSPISFPRWA